MVSFNSAGREGRPALALRIVHTGCTAGGLEHPRVVLVGLVFPASLLPAGLFLRCVDGHIPQPFGISISLCFYVITIIMQDALRRAHRRPPLL